jgi:hypothetical protein
MHVFLVGDDRGAVTTDWVALTAGIIVLGIVVTYSVLGNSHAYLIETFDHLNQGVENGNDELAALARSVDIAK